MIGGLLSAQVKLWSPALDVPLEEVSCGRAARGGGVRVLTRSVADWSAGDLPEYVL
jgi:hypothetical protein